MSMFTSSRTFPRVVAFGQRGYLLVAQHAVVVELRNHALAMELKPSGGFPLRQTCIESLSFGCFLELHTAPAENAILGTPSAMTQYDGCIKESRPWLLCKRRHNTAPSKKRRHVDVVRHRNDQSTLHAR